MNENVKNILGVLGAVLGIVMSLAFLLPLAMHIFMWWDQYLDKVLKW